jgi:prepilin-type processing-associated H-X9-DG protein
MLVELLVVIGVIVVMIGILLPVISRARQQAQAAKCMSNLRTLGQAMSAYVVETGHYPGAMANDGNLDFVIWTVRLRAFTSGNQSVFNCPSRDPSYYWAPENHQTRAPNVLARFGTHDIQIASGYREGERIFFDESGTRFCYGYNGGGSDFRFHKRGLGGVVPTSAVDMSGPHIRMTRELRLSRVKAPSDMIAIAESPEQQLDLALEPHCALISPAPYVEVMERGSKLWQPPSVVHYSGLNVLFADGHVRRCRREEIVMPSYNATTPEARRIAAMWNADNRP